MKKKSLELQELINVYGPPDALIDNHYNTNMGYAIWGFEDIFHNCLSNYLIENHSQLYNLGIKKNKMQCLFRIIVRILE